MADLSRKQRSLQANLAATHPTFHFPLSTFHDEIKISYIEDQRYKSFTSDQLKHIALPQTI